MFLQAWHGDSISSPEKTRVFFRLCEYSPAAPLLDCAVLPYTVLLLLVVCCWLLAGFTMADSRKEAALPCLLDASAYVVVIILPEVGACPTSSCFLLWCAYICCSFRLHHDGKGHRAAINHYCAQLGDTRMRSQISCCTQFLLLLVLSLFYVDLIFRFHSFHATHFL